MAVIPENQKYLDKSGLQRVGEVINSKLDDCISKPIEVTYERLLYLRKTGSLKDGQRYRITDYICKSDIIGITCEEHRFDIVVQAIARDRLLERGTVMPHYNLEDDYFYNNNLYTWEVWYCLDNDKSRFSWASENGTGVIYRMIDEWGNDCPYDFKNIKINNKYTFDDNGKDGSMAGIYWNNVIKKYTNNGIQYINNVMFENAQESHDNIFELNCHDILINSKNYYIEAGYNINNYTIGDIREEGDWIIYIRYNSFGNIINYCEADLINF